MESLLRDLRKNGLWFVFVIKYDGYSGMFSKQEEMSHNPNLLPDETDSLRNLHQKVNMTQTFYQS